jgi:hypothetical protein
VHCEPNTADDGTATGSQRSVVNDQQAVPRIVMSERLPGNARTTTLRTAMQLHHARLECEMEDQRDQR